MLLGYTSIINQTDTHRERHHLCVDHINALVGSASRPGILVLLSGKEGWLKQRGVGERIQNLLNDDWKIELVSWSNDYPNYLRYRVMSHSEGYTRVRLDTFYTYLFPDQ